MAEAVIFNVQKFSVNDGPGVRTTVFFKGCPLRCKWCANPESQRREIEEMDGKAQGRWRSVEDVYRECMQDEDFYLESGGGVTLSGGEVLLWPDFAAELLSRLRASGVHTALETTGFASRPKFLRVIGGADLLLFDMKHFDNERHRAGTGVRAEIIWGNLAETVRLGKYILPRIPVIPGFNDALSDARGFAARLKSLGLSKAQLLPFHQLGERKYELLGREYALAGLKGLREEDLADFCRAMRDEGIDAFF